MCTYMYSHTGANLIPPFLTILAYKDKHNLVVVSMSRNGQNIPRKASTNISCKESSCCYINTYKVMNHYAPQISGEYS